MQSLSDTIFKTSGMDTKKYADKYLFSALGINNKNWACDFAGHYEDVTPKDIYVRLPVFE